MRLNTEELSEEDQQLKAELEMLVERLEVSLLPPKFSEFDILGDIHLMTFVLGIECVALQAIDRCHQQLHPNSYIIYDCSPKTPQIPQTTF